ncbi:MAG: hypothetical protein U1E56_06175 [Bauldia sp.]
MLNAFFVFLSLLIVLMVGGAAVVGLSFHGPIFETSGPDYERYARILELSNRDAGEEPAREPIVLDLADLNGGNWSMPVSTVAKSTRSRICGREELESPKDGGAETTSRRRYWRNSGNTKR